MAHYIDKSVVVAEIERRIKEHHSGYLVCLKDMLSFIDTLEVKDVDLEKELILWHKDHFKKEDTYEKYSGFYLTNNSQLDLAKHFFELGMRVNNPITAADRGMAEEIIINLKRVERDYRIDLTKEIEWLRNQVKK